MGEQIKDDSIESVVYLINTLFLLRYQYLLHLKLIEDGYCCYVKCYLFISNTSSSLQSTYSLSLQEVSWDVLHDIYMICLNQK